MAHILMAPNTVKFSIVDHTVCGNFADKIAVAKQAVCIQYFGIPRLDADRITKNPVGECDGMMIAIACLRHPLTDEIVRHVAVVAGRKRMMAGFLPTVKVLAHNVAIDAYLGFIRYIGCSAPGIKSKSTSAQKNAHQHIEQQFHTVLDRGKAQATTKTIGIAIAIGCRRGLADCLTCECQTQVGH